MFMFFAVGEKPQKYPKWDKVTSSEKKLFEYVLYVAKLDDEKIGYVDSIIPSDGIVEITKDEAKKYQLENNPDCTELTLRNINNAISIFRIKTEGGTVLVDMYVGDNSVTTGGYNNGILQRKYRSTKVFKWLEATVLFKIGLKNKAIETFIRKK